jgi:hypothetical protein
MDITDYYQVVTYETPHGEGNQRIEAGTYVVGGEYADNDGTEVWIHVDFALDTNGHDATKHVAERIAAALAGSDVQIHNHHTPEGQAQIKRLAAVIGRGRRDDMADEGIASSVLVALLDSQGA